MIDVYCKLIIAKSKNRTFDNVPENFKEAVKERLKELGYDTNGDPIVEG